MSNAEFEVEDSEAEKRAGTRLWNVSATEEKALHNLAERKHQPRTRPRLYNETVSATENQNLYSSLINFC